MFNVMHHSGHRPLLPPTPAAYLVNILFVATDLCASTIANGACGEKLVNLHVIEEKLPTSGYSEQLDSG